MGKTNKQTGKESRNELIMDTKQKANELVNKYWSAKVDTFHVVESICSKELAIECALIAVDEVINTDMLIDEDVFVITPSYLDYWQEVKQELHNYKICTT